MTINAPLVQAPDPGGTPPKLGPGPRPRILVVEDHEDSREMLRHLLELEGYDVKVAEDGRRGLDAALADPPVIALIDLGLPVLDGFEVARAIRARFGRSVWLVALTSRTAPADRRRSAEVGFDLHVAKPVAPDRLRGILRDIVSRAKGPS
jgi:DNA-binding response OmpR family regulator